MTSEEKRTKSRETSQAYRDRNRERVRQYSREYGREWRKRPENREKNRIYLQTYGPQKRRNQKLAVLNAYGGPICSCCGESEVTFLTMDHIAGDGASHRREIWGVNAGTIYRWLIKQGFPPGFQVLCFNCNYGRHANGGVCPHEQAALRLVAGGS